MRSFYFFLTALLPGSLAVGPVLNSRDSCASVTGHCPLHDKAESFCSGYLGVKPQKTTTRVTVSTLTLSTDKTAGTITTNICPTHGGPQKRKRNEDSILEDRAPEPTPAMDPNDALFQLEKRATVPSCLSKYTASSQLSSACNCWQYPETTSTRHVTRTTTLKGAPTKTKYVSTVTLTTLEPVPTCKVVSGSTTWTEFYGLCNGFRSGGLTPEDDGHVFPAKTSLCDALNLCANATIGEGSKTFELSYNEFDNRPGGPKWDCRGYGAGPGGVEYFLGADNWYETYGYYHN